MANLNAIRTMAAKDVVSAKLANAYVTIDGNRYLLFQAKSITANFKKTKQEVDILGRTTKGHKSTGGSCSGTLTIYYNTSIFTQLFKKYKDTGEDTYFDLQLSNIDPTSDAGEHRIILKDCNLDGGQIAAFDAAGDWLEQELDFTFEDWEEPKPFNMLAGMKA